eukprot:334092_1
MFRNVSVFFAFFILNMSTPLRTKDRLVSIIVLWLKRQEFQSVNVKPRNAAFAYIVVQGYCYIRYKDFGVDNIRYFIARFIQQLLSVRHGYDIKSMDDDSVFKVIRHHFGKRFIFNQTELFVHISLLLTGIIQYCEFQILVNKQNHHNNKHYNNHIINMDFLNQFKQFVQSKASLRYTDKYDTTKNGSILAIYNIQRASINELAKKYGDYGEINKTSDQKWKICYKQNLFDSRCTILIEFKNPPKVKLVLFLDIIVGSNSDKAAKTGWINANTAAKYDSKEVMLSDAIIRAKNDKHLADIIDEYKNKIRIFPKNIAIVMGKEAEGPSEEFLEYCDKKIYLPQFGFCESYNVSVACALGLQKIFSMDTNIRGQMNEIERNKLRYLWYYQLVNDEEIKEEMRALMDETFECNEDIKNINKCKNDFRRDGGKDCNTKKINFKLRKRLEYQRKQNFVSSNS